MSLEHRPKTPLAVRLVRLHGAQVLVVGGSEHLLPHVLGLIRAGASITLVAEEVCPAIQLMAERIHRLELRKPRQEDVLGKRLVVAGSGDMETDRELAFVARWHGILVTVPYELESSDFEVLS